MVPEAPLEKLEGMSVRQLKTWLDYFKQDAILFCTSN